jgi:hypothetical protein
LPEAVRMQSVIPHDEGHGGVTLLDLVLMISGSWALPAAVQWGIGNETIWLFPAYLVGAASGFFGGWYCRRLLRLMYRQVFADTPVLANRRTKTVAMAAYVSVLILGLALQYSLYRAIRFLLTFVHSGA